MKSRKTMNVKPPKLNRAAKVTEQIGKAMSKVGFGSAMESGGDIGGVPYADEQVPAWVSKLAKDAAKGLPNLKTLPKADLTIGRIVVLPLVKTVNGVDLLSKAREITFALRASEIDAIVVENGPISRRYKAADEAGIRACLTVDSGTVKNQTVTVREYGKKKQYRAKIKSVIKKFKTRVFVGKKNGRVFIVDENGKPAGAQG